MKEAEYIRVTNKVKLTIMRDILYDLSTTDKIPVDEYNLVKQKINGWIVNLEKRS